MIRPTQNQNELTQWNGHVAQKVYFVEFTASQLLCNDAVSQFINVNLEEKGGITLTQGNRTIKTAEYEKLLLTLPRNASSRVKC